MNGEVAFVIDGPGELDLVPGDELGHFVGRQGESDREVFLPVGRGRIEPDATVRTEGYRLPVFRHGHLPTFGAFPLVEQHTVVHTYV